MINSNTKAMLSGLSLKILENRLLAITDRIDTVKTFRKKMKIMLYNI